MGNDCNQCHTLYLQLTLHTPTHYFYLGLSNLEEKDGVLRVSKEALFSSQLSLPYGKSALFCIARGIFSDASSPFVAHDLHPELNEIFVLG